MSGTASEVPMRRRYHNLMLEMYRNRAVNLCEIGTFNGMTAAQMVRAACLVAKNKGSVRYYGFDLFEDATEEMLQEQGSGMGPCEFGDALTRITEAIPDNDTAMVNLIRGDTRQTLPEYVNANPDLTMDLIFIDGGHHPDTIRSDWRAVQPWIGPGTVVLFDDYYHDNANMGCKSIVEGLSLSHWDVEALSPSDIVEGADGQKLQCNFVSVRQKTAAPKVVFELDDLCDRFDPWDQLVTLKLCVPALKVTLFTIPGMCSDDLIERYAALDWVELAVHGMHHSTYECATWGEGEAGDKIRWGLEKIPTAKGFKAPGWIASPAVYTSLKLRQELFNDDFYVADHLNQFGVWIQSGGPLNRYVYNAPPPDVIPVHGHTWDTMGNGPDWWSEKVYTLPRDKQFAFVSEVAR